MSISSLSSENNDINLKILILGDSSVGKTSLLLQYSDGYFPTVYVATIGVEYKLKTLKINGIDINLQIWDTAGQERFKSITKNFIKDSDGILFVYDITQKKTFDNLKTWIRLSEDSTEGFEKIIVGNKIDLENERNVSREIVKKFCEDKKIREFEISAKIGTNVDDVFETLAKLIVGDKSKEELIKKFSNSARGKRLSISSEETVKKGKKKCC